MTELQGKSKILLRLDTVTPKWISQAYYATDSYISGNKDTLQKTLKALFQAAHFIRENPGEGAAIASKTLQWPEEAVARAQKVSGPLLSKDGVLSVEALEVMQTTLLEYKAQDKRVPTADLYAPEFTPVGSSGSAPRSARRRNPRTARAGGSPKGTERSDTHGTLLTS